MQPRCSAVAFLITLALAFTLACPTVQPTLSSAPTRAVTATATSDAWASIQDAYALLEDAFTATGMVPQADVDLLNQAIEKVSLAEIVASSNSTEAQALTQQANAIVQQVKQDIAKAKEEGLMQKQNNAIILAVSVAGTLAAAALVYKFGPGGLWKIWLRMRKDYDVKVQEQAIAERAKPPKKAEGGHREDENGRDDDDDKGKTAVTMETISAIIAVALVVLASIAVAQVFLAGRQGETFSELGMLGPNQMIGDYPREVVAGDAVHLFAYVGNHMGKPVWYSVLAKVGDNSTAVDPAAAGAVLRLDRVLANGENWTSPMSLALTQPGLNQRLIFELWSFNATTKALDYTQRWVQLWVNVTLPP